MTTSNSIGERAERLAENFLIRKSWQILERNFRHGPHEIDIIAQKENLIVFVEVKARSSNTFGYPETMISPNQMKSIQTAAEAYLYNIQWEYRIRFDVISIEQGNSSSRLWHIEDAF